MTFSLYWAPRNGGTVATCCPPVLSVWPFEGLSASPDFSLTGTPFSVAYSGPATPSHVLNLSVDKLDMPPLAPTATAFLDPIVSSGGSILVTSVVPVPGAANEIDGVTITFDMTGIIDGGVYWVRLANVCGCCTGFGVIRPAS